MRFSRNTAIFGLLVTLFVGQIGQSTGKAKIINREKTSEAFGKLAAQKSIEGVIETAIPSVAVIFPPPLGPALSVSLGILYGIFRFSEGSQKDLKWEEKIAKKVENLEKQLTEKIERSTEKLLMAIESYHYLKDMREQLDSMSSTYSAHIVCVLNVKCEKSEMLNFLTNPLSDFRTNSRDFTTKYLDSPKEDMQNAHLEKFYFDFIIEKDRLDVKENIDCYNATYHTRIFKVYNLIHQVLTENYVLIIAGHVAKYQQVNTIDPEVLGTRKNVIADLSREYLGHIRTLMTKTKWALSQSSREIRNCGKFKLERGKTFERLNFVSTRFQIFESEGFAFWSDCVLRHPDGIFNNNGFKMFNCQYLGRGNHDISIDPSDENRPYFYVYKSGVLKSRLILPGWRSGGKKNYHGSSGSYRKRLWDDPCRINYCSAYKPKRVGVSIQSMRAQSGYVITGVRWRVKNDIFYIQIQEGEYIDPTQVNRSTVHWVETEIKPDSIIYLEETVREISLVDTELESDYFVTYLRLTVNSGRINLELSGRKGAIKSGLSDNWTYQMYRGSPQNEVVLGRDDPELVENNNVYVRNRGSSFVKFIATGFDEDVGRTTIPYLDLRDVITDPPAPISGIGLYHQAVPGFGGFISLKMFSPDYRNMINFKKLEEFFEKHQ